MPGNERKPLLGHRSCTSPHRYTSQCYGSSAHGSSLKDDDKGMEQTKKGEADPTPSSVNVTPNTDYCFQWKKLWAFAGPGFLMSIAFLDPGNIQSDLQAGAFAHYKLLWVLMWSTIMGLVLQLLSARLGSVTGMHLAEVCRQEYSRVPCVVLWVMTEVAIIGSDVQEVVGSAIAIGLLSNHKVPMWAGVLITGVDTFTFLFLESAGLRKLEGFFGVLILIMAAAFLYMYVMVGPDQGLVLQGLVYPWCTDCDREAIKQLVGIVGAVIMPHNIYLHSALVLSRDVNRRIQEAVKEANMYQAIEAAVALFISFLVNLFIVSVFAAAFSDTNYATLRQAGDWLNDHYGLAMKIMWAVGLLAAGQSSVMTGTYAGQFVIEGFLDIHCKKWKRVLVIRAIAIVPTVIIAVVMVEQLDDMILWLNILQSVQLPFALIPVMHFTNSQRIMGQFRNPLFVRCVVGLIVILITAVNMYLVSLYLDTDWNWYMYAVCGLVLFVYGSFLVYLGIGIPHYLQLKCWVKQKCGCSVWEEQEEITRRRLLVYPMTPNRPCSIAQETSTSLFNSSSVETTA